jgi:hypothetical protein
MMEAITRPSQRLHDVVGKPFRVLASGFRQCMVCEQTFSSLAARSHALLPCWPEKIVPNSLVSRLGARVMN